ncbi:hypothetical protein ACYZUC_12695 [Pseudomonas sp. GT1P32]
MPGFSAPFSTAFFAHAAPAPGETDLIRERPDTLAEREAPNCFRVDFFF